MRYDPDYTAQYYNQYGTSEWERWEKSDHTRLLLDRYLREVRAHVHEGDRVLETGPGAGRFTRELIAIGAEVTAFDIAPVQLDLCRTNAPGAHAYELGTVVDLSRFADDSFDVVLGIGGVLSYCFDHVQTAISEMHRVLKPGGTIGVGVMNLYGSMHLFLPGVLAIDLEMNREITSTGDLPRTQPDTDHECHLFTPGELRALLNDFTDVTLTSVGWVTSAHAVALPAPGTAEYEWLVEIERIAALESPGAGTHILAWGRKR